MNKAIYKYELPLTGETTINSPGTSSEVLSVRNQRNKLCVWILCTPGVSATTEHRFYTVMTGESHVPGYKAEFFGTVLLDEGDYVVHVFERHPEDQ
jgi:hypothetical protein